MLEKVVSINAVGRFFSCNPPGDIMLAPLTLIHGHNGQGKSTLTAIIRSMSDGKPDQVLSRQSLHTRGQSKPTIHIRHSGLSVKFNGTAWDSHPDNFLIFDQDFIHANVFMGNEISYEHRKNLHTVIIGEDVGTKSARIAEIDTLSRGTSTTIGALETFIDGKITQLDITRATFLGLSPTKEQLEGIDLQIQSLQKGIEDVPAVEALSSHPNLLEIEVPSLAENWLPLLLSGAELNPDLAAVLDTLDPAQRATAEAWLYQGLKYLSLTDPACPFCEADTSSSSRVSDIRMLASEEYELSKGLVSAVGEQIETAFADSVLMRLSNASTTNLSAISAWQTLAKIDPVPTLPNESIETLRASKQTLLEMVSIKANSPLAPVDITTEAATTLRKLNNLIVQAAQYNVAIVGARESIEKVRKAVLTEANQVKLKSLGRLKAIKERDLPATASKCNELLKAQKLRDDLAGEKSRLKGEIETVSSRAHTKYESAVNKYLEELGCAFRLSQLKSTYAGGKPNSSFSFTLDNRPVEIAAKGAGPAFHTAFSGADRTTLALAFFLAMVDSNSSLDKAIVVIDDPIAHSDLNRRNFISLHLALLAQRCEQLIVLSHSEEFLTGVQSYAIKKGTRSKVMRIVAVGNFESSLEPSSLDEIEHLYFDGRSSLLAYNQHRIGDRLAVAIALRTTLETYYRYRFPEAFPRGKWLGDFVGIARLAAANTPLGDYASKHMGDLEIVNEFSKDYHGTVATPPNEPELADAVMRALRLLEA
ncbi:MAG: AAA family ATPase [bacterium]